MGCDLELTASRSITVNMIGKIETQSYDLHVQNFTREICELIVNSDNPYDEYCKQLRLNDYTEPIYIWDDPESWKLPDVIEREHQASLHGAKEEDIVGFSKASDDWIKRLDYDIKQALHNHYELRWWISY